MPIALAVILAGGCGSSTSSTSTEVHHPRPVHRARHSVRHARHHSHSRRRPSAKLSPVGRTVRVHAAGTILSVTIQQVINPLRGSGALLTPGTHAVGVMAEIVDDGPGGYNSSSTGDFSIVPSSGAAVPVFARSGRCQTPLRDWDNEIGPGESRNGCVTFAMPNSAHLVAVQFSPNAQPRGRVSWSG